MVQLPFLSTTYNDILHGVDMKLYMKKLSLLNVVLLPCLLCSFTSSYAQTVNGSVNLKVTGKIVPASCDLILGTGTSVAGELDYGNITAVAGPMPSGTPVSLGALTLNSAVTLNCDGRTLIGINTVDNRAASSVNYTNLVSPDTETVYIKTYNLNGTVAGAAKHFLGLGVDAKGTPIGSYSGTFINLKVDGVLSRFSTCMAETTHTGAAIEQSGALVVASCPAGQSHQILDTSNNVKTGSTYVWDYKISTETLSPDDLDANGWSLDGSVTVQVNYL